MLRGILIGEGEFEIVGTCIGCRNYVPKETWVINGFARKRQYNGQESANVYEYSVTGIQYMLSLLEEYGVHCENEVSALKNIRGVLISESGVTN